MGLGLTLDLRPVAFGLQRFFPLLARIAPVGINVAARVAGVEQRLEVPAVVGAGRVGLQTPDELVLAIDTEQALVAVVALAMFLGPGGVEVFLTAFRRTPPDGHGEVVRNFFDHAHAEGLGSSETCV